MATNVLQLLERKRCGGCGSCSERVIVNSLQRRHISLREIADPLGQILNGHVVLGFTRCGLYLISYLCEVSPAPPEPEYHYSLYWWRFDLYKPLQLTHRYELFSEEHLFIEVHLIVAQSADLQSMVVLGCRLPCSVDDHRPCYMSVLQSPELATKECVIHFKFDLLPPFPSFYPSVCLKISGCVLLNTGDSLVCVHYMVNSTPSKHTLVESPIISQSSPLLSAHTHAVSSHCQYFTLNAPQHPSTTDLTAAASPNHLLPMDVYYNGQIMAPISADSAQLTDSADGAELTVKVRQSRFDVELWLNATLQRELDYRGYSFSSLNDYDLQLVEVCAESREVVFLLVVVVEAQHHLALSSSSYSLELVGSWKAFTQHITTMDVSQPSLISPLTPRSAWTDTPRLAMTLRKKCSIPSAQHGTITAFSNHTVYTGKSLQALIHPSLPVTLVLKKFKRCLVIHYT